MSKTSGPIRLYVRQLLDDNNLYDIVIKKCFIDLRKAYRRRGTKYHHACVHIGYMHKGELNWSVAHALTPIDSLVGMEIAVLKAFIRLQQPLIEDSIYDDRLKGLLVLVEDYIYKYR